MDDNACYRRNLPHYQPSRATFFITFRLAGSLPAGVIRQLREEQIAGRKRVFKSEKTNGQANKSRLQRKLSFKMVDSILDRASSGPTWLRDQQIASLVEGAIRFRDHKEYELLAYCIMPNHVHLVFTVERNDISLYRILQSLKRFTAREANKILQRSGAFWQHESYDHVVRKGDELTRIVQYILDNPVKAGLVDSWEKWPWIYCKPDLLP